MQPCPPAPHQGQTLCHGSPSSGWTSVSPAALYGPCLGSPCFRTMGTCLLIRLCLSQVTGLLTVLLRHAWPTQTQLLCRCVYQFFMPHHPSQTWPWQCAPPCATRREESGSLRVQFCSHLISYFLHTHISRSPRGSSPHPGYFNCASHPHEGLSN